jgi:2-C-methyl-D-erythritol 4-phosphate cytidylyltransferase
MLSAGRTTQKSGTNAKHPTPAGGGCSSDFRIYDEAMADQRNNSLNSAPAAAPAEGVARVFVLIPCAGSGSRALAPGAAATLAKQYQPLAGQPMVSHTVDAFRALGLALAGLWLLISPDDTDFETVFPGFPGLPGSGLAGEKLLRCGGATRAATVRQGLQALLSTPGAADPLDWVLVHDAARCLVTPAQIRQLIDTCRDDAVGGLLAQPLADTLKAEAPLAGAQGPRVSTTLDRAGKWLAQTPQMFRVGALLDALVQAERKGLAVTDESSAMEALGLSPRLVRGSAHNLKVTYPEDFALADALLQSRLSFTHSTTGLPHDLARTQRFS